MRSYVQITGLLLLMLSACQPSLYNTPKTRAVSINGSFRPMGWCTFLRVLFYTKC